MEFTISLHLSAWQWFGFVLGCALAISTAVFAIWPFFLKRSGDYDFGTPMQAIILWLFALVCTFASALTFVLVFK